MSTPTQEAKPVTSEHELVVMIHTYLHMTMTIG